MKKLIFSLGLIMALTASAQQNEVPDSISATLDEVEVTADSRSETAKKVILRPTVLEKKHSTNGYTLLENMNLPDFNVSASQQTISTVTGRSVVLLVNGVEIQSEELATLAASQIVQIDYQRNPGGKYAGSGAVINFITAQRDYGGNLYLSADEGFARQFGNYTGMANYKRKAITLTLTANGKWDNISQLKSEERSFLLNDGPLHQSITPTGNTTRTNSQYLNLKFAHAADNHSFDASLALTRSATPKNLITTDAAYSGLYNFASTAIRSGKEAGLSPVLKMHYNLYLPGGHTLTAFARISHGHTDFRSVYRESDVEILNNTLENNLISGLTLGYFKSLASNLSLGITIDDKLDYYHDTYSGSFDGKQTLTNNHAMAMLHIDHSLHAVGLSYYASAGMTDLYSTIDNHTDNQLSPMAFYGVTYNINPRHTLSVIGNFAHSIYNPSYKNNAEIRTSLFEATAGNPDLKQVQAFQNMVTYNGRIGRFGLSFTYDYLNYSGNTSNRYFAENNVMFHQLVNDGSFNYHRLIIGASANLINNRLRLKGNAIYSMNRFNSEYRPARSNDLRADFSAAYMFGDWQVKVAYAVPYAVLSIEGAKVHEPAQYALSLNWQKGRWAAELSIANFLRERQCTLTDADYGSVYQSVSRSFSNLKGRCISLSVTYMLPYGKKTEKERITTESTVNSAIMRPF